MKVVLVYFIVSTLLTRTSTAFVLEFIGLFSGIITIVSFYKDAIQEIHDTIQHEEELAEDSRRYENILSRFDTVDRNLEEIIQSGANNTRRHQQILTLFEVVNSKLEGIQMGLENIENILHGMTQKFKWFIRLETLEKYISDIKGPYRLFLHYQRHKENIELYTLDDFATNVLSHSSSSVLMTMGKISDIVAPDAPLIPETLPHLRRRRSSLKSTFKKIPNSVTCSYNPFMLNYQPMSANCTSSISKRSTNPSIYVTLHDVIKVSNYCNLSTTPEEILARLFALITLTQTRAFAMVNFAYMIQETLGRGNFTAEYTVSKSLFEHFINYSTDRAFREMKKLDNSFHTCAPSTHIEGTTYVRLTELLQGHIQVGLNPFCPINDMRTHMYRSFNQLTKLTKRCRGTLHNCKEVTPSAAMVCVSGNRNRRFEYVKFGNELYGEETTMRCNKYVGDQCCRRRLYIFSPATNCLCLCDDPSSRTTDRYVSLMPTVTDVSNNYVMTGIKFIKRNRIMMLQIQEGKALPNGQVDENTVKWVTQPYVDMRMPWFRSGIHYEELNYTSRHMNLQDLKAPDGHVLTGVKFARSSARLDLEIQVTSINFTSGNLQLCESRWVSMSLAALRYDELDLSNSRNSVKVPATDDDMVINHGMVVQFQPTSWEDDVAQNTVPYFDAQPVFVKPASWMNGLNLRHRGTPNTGGFLFLEASYYNLARNIEMPSL